MKAIILGIVLLLVLSVPTALFFLSGETALSLDPAVTVIGTDTPVTVQASNPHGTRLFRAFLEQNGHRYDAFTRVEPPTRMMFWRARKPAEKITFSTGTSKVKALKPGKARLIVEADSNDLRGKTTTLARDIQIITEPPRLFADGLQHYINQGGSELVTFQVSGYWTEAGVRVGPYTFRSFPMPGQNDPNKRFSLFAYSWELPPTTMPYVYARNPAGQEVRATFWTKVFPKKFRSRDLDLSDAFLQKVTTEIDPQGSGDLLQRFLKINGEMRKQNNQTLADLRLKTEERFLWSEPFKQLGNSKVESFFADKRSYMYQGKKVDEQVHLGFDLSVTQNVQVVSANAGKVVWADRLGIYGNCVVVDHGYGLQSIYAHLNSLDVKPGDMVARDQKLGNSGATGLAGGDHLHFTMQVDGVQINPVEWWDDHWIKDRIRSKVPVGESAPKAAK